MFLIVSTLYLYGYEGERVAGLSARYYSYYLEVVAR
jgi:hypothetical protein